MQIDWSKIFSYIHGRADKKIAEEKMKKIKEAYSDIGKEEKKAEYY